MSKLEFKISSEIKNILGRDLITNENVAIFELVKNSYDAHASKVIITFETDRIIIADNGKGMSLDDIKDKWLFLGFSAKKDGTEDLEYNKSYRDKIKRHYAGAKGIGRLSCDRIAHELILTTKSISSPKQERIKINWDDFEKDQGNEFGKIAINYLDVSIPPIYPDNSTTGTILELSILRSKWSRDNIRDLKSSLEKLINPFSETYDFQI